MDVFPNEIVKVFMLFLPLKSLFVFSSVCKRIRTLSKELLDHPHFVDLRKKFVLAKLISTTIWPQESWRTIHSLATSFKGFRFTGFNLEEFIRDHGEYFVMKHGMVWNLKFGPDK